MLKHSFLSIVFVFFANFIFSQSTTTAQDNPNLTFEKKIEGTYEIIILDPKITEVFTNDFMKIIEEKREDNKDVTYDVSRYTRFLIYSRARINSPGFIKNKTNK